MSAEDMPGDMTDGFHLVVEALKLNGIDTRIRTRAPNRYRLAPGHFVELSAFDEFHAEVARAIPLIHFVNGDNACMIETGGGFGFPFGGDPEDLLRGYLSGELFRRGLICRADDRGDPVIQLAPPLIDPAAVELGKHLPIGATSQKIRPSTISIT